MAHPGASILASLSLVAALIAAPAAHALPRKADASHGRAAVVFLYPEGSYLLTLARETVDLRPLLSSYDEVLLLGQKARVGAFLAAPEGRAQDLFDRPTKAGLGRALAEVARKGRSIDLFVLAHGDAAGLHASAGTEGSVDTIKDADIRGFLSPSGFSRLPIRVVYQLGGFGSALDDAWSAIGARAVAGPRDVNFYPGELAAFAERFRGGQTFGEALAPAEPVRAAVDAFLAGVHAPATASSWGGCPAPYTVLSAHPCAKSYFDAMWGGFEARGAGKAWVRWASTMVVKGDPSITIDTRPTWD
jgi:hypothetical protein